MAAGEHALPPAWQALFLEINDRPALGAAGIRDPEYPCTAYDPRGYSGRGKCLSDGHFLCTNCRELSADDPRFQHRDSQGKRVGRGYRLRLYWASGPR